MAVGRFEGDLNEKGLKRAGSSEEAAAGRFEGDLNEKGLKLVPRIDKHRCGVLKET